MDLHYMHNSPPSATQLANELPIHRKATLCQSSHWACRSLQTPKKCNQTSSRAHYTPHNLNLRSPISIRGCLLLLPGIQAVIWKADTSHVGPIPLQRHGHLPQILRYERLLERAHIERRGPVRGVVMQLHVAGEVGTEAVGGRRAH